MPIAVNLRHLENGSVHLDGEISARELDLEELDEMIHAKAPLTYDLDVEQSGQTLLVTGEVDYTLDCECVRCLKPFQHRIHFEDYHLEVPLEGEERAEVVSDMVDLTPYVREDILLAFPQHPVCETECDRLPPLQSSEDTGGSAQPSQSAWDELNKLKF